LTIPIDANVDEGRDGRDRVFGGGHCDTGRCGKDKCCQPSA